MMASRVLSWLSNVRQSSRWVLSVFPLVLACYGNGSGSSSGGASGSGGTFGNAGTSGAGAAGGSVSTAGSGFGGNSGGSTLGGASSGGASTGGAGSGTAGSSPSNLYAPPSEIIGGPCAAALDPEIAPCAFAPEQVYCALSDATRVIMAVCSAAGRSQCEVMSECEPGWHACTATDYVARGGRDVPPAFSSATDRAWLAACVRDVTGTEFKNEPCSVCGQDPSYEPSIQWWCDGAVVYEGGMAGDTLGVLAGPDCMRVGMNAASHGAFWSMSFSDGAPSFVMCCLDEL